MGAKFTCSLSDAGELVLLIQDFSLADVGEYKVIVENELGDVSQIIRMEMSGNSACDLSRAVDRVVIITRNAFCGTWYLPHSHVHNERTDPIIIAGCTAHARNGRISTSGEKSDVTIVFPDQIS